MGSQVLPHPDHVVPAVELVPAVFEDAHRFKAQMGMELGTVEIQVFVRLFRIPDAGVHIQDSHFFQGFQKCSVQFLSQTFLPEMAVHINAQFRSPVIGRPPHKGAGIGIAQDPAVLFRHEIGIAFPGMGDPPAEFLHTGHLVFKSDHGTFHIGCIDGTDGGSILHGSFPDNHIAHGYSPCFYKMMILL